MTSARVVCLVRAGGEAEALKRIQRNLAQYLIDAGDRASRIVPLAGDLAQPRLGLTEEQFARLAQDVDVIYHNGAQVHFLHPYSTLKPANVLGTQEVLRLAATTQLKPVHFVSTLSVLSGLSQGTAGGRDRSQRNSGMARKRLRAEQMGRRAAGLVGHGSRDSGDDLASRPDRLAQPNRASESGRRIHAGAAGLHPNCGGTGADSVLEMTPVDYISRATIAIAGIRRRPAGPTTCSIASTFACRTCSIGCAAGYPLEVLPPDQWLAQSAVVGDARCPRRVGRLAAAACQRRSISRR